MLNPPILLTAYFAVSKIEHIDSLKNGWEQWLSQFTFPINVDKHN